MLIFQLRVAGNEKGRQLPKVRMTVSEIEKKIGAACPNKTALSAIAMQILKLSESRTDAEQAVARVKKAFVKIKKAAGNEAIWAFKALGTEKLAELFVKKTDAFVRIAEAAGLQEDAQKE